MRTLLTEIKYRIFKRTDKAKQCYFCEPEIIQEFDLWIICVNQFAHDKSDKISHLLSPKRHIASFEKLNSEEKAEFLIILNSLDIYSSISLNTTKWQTVPGHLHFHLYQRRIAWWEPVLDFIEKIFKQE